MELIMDAAPIPGRSAAREIPKSVGGADLGRSAFRLSGWTMTGLLTLLVAAVVAATSLGYIRLPFTAVLQIMAARLFDQPGWLAALDPVWPVVVTEVRLPRILCSTVVGAGLAMCGVVFQGILLNPLADPYTLGVSAGAAFGAAVALLLNISFLGAFSVPLFAFAGAVATLCVVIFYALIGFDIGGFNPLPPSTSTPVPTRTPTRVAGMVTIMM